MLRLRKSNASMQLGNLRALTTQSASKPKTEEVFDPEWQNARPCEDIPTPSGFSALLNVLPGGRYAKLNMIEIFEKVREDFGNIVRFPGTLNRRDVIITFDPKDFEKVYRTEGPNPGRLQGFESLANFRQNYRQDIYEKTTGLLTDQGPSWGALRSTVNPVMLQPKTVKLYIPQVDEIACEFLELLKASRDGNNEVPSTFGNDLNKWALESIGCIALDQRLGALEGNDPTAIQMIKNGKEFVKLSYQLDFQPSLWRCIKTPKFYKLMRLLDEHSSLVSGYITKALDHLNSRQGSRENSQREAGVLEKLLKIDKNVAIVMATDMLVAGVDTTSSGTVGCLYHLAKNPEKQEKLRDEIRKTFPNTNAKLTPDSLNSIPYLRACIKEALRLSPVLSGGIRAAGQNIVLQGYRVPKGHDVVLSGTLLQRDENYFPQNKQFIPERWLKGNVSTECPSARNNNPFIYLPFGFGARACIGRRFSEMEMEILLIRILQKYKVEWNYKPIQYMTSLIQIPIGDLKFKFTELKD